MQLNNNEKIIIGQDSINLLKQFRILHSIIINGYMIHPDDAKWRNEYVHKTLLIIVKNDFDLLKKKGIKSSEIHKLLSVFISNSVKILGGWKKFTENVLTFRKEPLEDDYAERFVTGMAVGKILHTALEYNISKTESAQRLINDLNDTNQLDEKLEFSIFHVKKKFTLSNLTTNIWSKYKQVAHLWASLHNFSYKEDVNYGNRAFIDFSSLKSTNQYIQAEGINGFLALSDEYLKRASRFKADNAGETILSKEEALNLNDPLNLIKSAS